MLENRRETGETVVGDDVLSLCGGCCRKCWHDAACSDHFVELAVGPLTRTGDSLSARVRDARRPLSEQRAYFDGAIVILV